MLIRVKNRFSKKKVLRINTCTFGDNNFLIKIWNFDMQRMWLITCKQ